jgi:hypothetical protein
MGKSITKFFKLVVIDFLSSALGSIELIAFKLRVALIQKTKNYVGNN